MKEDLKQLAMAGTGALIDQRTEEEKKKDWYSEEAFASQPYNWSEKVTWTSYPIFRQWYTGQCVAQSTTKALGIRNLQETGEFYYGSPTDFYDHRVNKPGAGMMWDDAMQISVKFGACKNERIPQPKYDYEIKPVIRTEEMINEAFDKAGSSYFTVGDKSIDNIASIIAREGFCLLWFWFDINGNEWWRNQPTILYPSLGTYDVGATRHAVIAVDAVLIGGKKFIIIEDSAGNSSAIGENQRIISEEFLTKRCFVAGFTIDKKNLDYVQPAKPKYKFTRTLGVGSKGPDVEALQKILVYEGVLSLKTPTQNYLGMTQAAVKKYQEKYASEILAPLGLKIGTGFMGASTLKHLNKRYA